MVVTDDRGRYVIPDLPKANYSVWVRGYGLVDSPKVRTEPGQAAQSDGGAGAQRGRGGAVLPGDLLVFDAADPAGERVRRQERIPKERTQVDWLKQMKNIGCIGCHQLGQASTRTIPAGVRQLQVRRRGLDAPHAVRPVRRADDRTSSPATSAACRIKYYGDWTDRIAKGELPFAKPPRPQGVERNVVVTSWEWSTEKHYLHDLIASDRRNPTVNAYGPLYGSPEYSTDNMPILDPKTQQGDDLQDAGARSGHAGSARARACRERASRCALGLLGRGEALGHARQQPQRHVRQEGPRVARGDRARPGQSGVLQEGLRASVGQGVPARAVVAAGGDARSEDDEVHASSTPASARIIRSSATTPTTRCG